MTMVDAEELCECYRRIFHEVIGDGNFDEPALIAYCQGISAWTLDIVVGPLEKTITNLHLCLTRYILEFYPDEVKMVEAAIENDTLDDLPKDEIPIEVLQFVQGGLHRLFDGEETSDSNLKAQETEVTGDSKTGSRSDMVGSATKLCSVCGNIEANLIEYRDDDGNIEDKCCFDCARERHYAERAEVDKNDK